MSFRGASGVLVATPVRRQPVVHLTTIPALILQLWRVLLACLPIAYSIEWEQRPWTHPKYVDRATSTRRGVQKCRIIPYRASVQVQLQLNADRVARR